MTRFLNYVLTATILLAAQIPAQADAEDLIKAAILENDVVYFRVGAVATNLAAEIQSAQNALTATNKIAGTVLDLRFADGRNFAAAQTAANLFASKKLPLAILVNGETLGSAAALASELRAARDGLVFGSAPPPVKFSGKMLSVSPDIAVTVGANDERAFLKNPFGTLAWSETNSVTATNNFLPFVDHTSEADLVREKIKDGDEAENSAPPRATETPKPFIRDPVLARAVDLIKGLNSIKN
ncbi:MAG: hypothetical protein ACREFE_08710 [Limisphaerales bacterium]